MKLASAFLSHSEEDMPLVIAVQIALARLGVVAWVDRSDLPVGVSLSAQLKSAIAAHAVVVVFLSEAALSSRWVQDELRFSIEAGEHGRTLIPIYLGDPPALVARSPLLLEAGWQLPDGRVDRLGVAIPWPRTWPARKKIIDARTQAIAAAIARVCFHHIGLPGTSEAIVLLDQRGTGSRHVAPTLPEDVARLDAPMLRFRPDLDMRSFDETLEGPAWTKVTQALVQGLGLAFGGDRPKRLHLCGEAQLGLPYLVGARFDRTSQTDLLCYHRLGSMFTNQGQTRTSPLSHGDPWREVTPAPGDLDFPVARGLPTVGLMVGFLPLYFQAAGADLEASHPETVLFWRRTPKEIATSAEAMAIVADVVALVTWLCENRGTRCLRLYLGLPTHAVALLAANLTVHVVSEVQLMEFRKHTTESPRYAHLPMPS